MSDEGVSVKPLAAGASGLNEGIWRVEHEGNVLLRFDGAGAEARARSFAEGVRADVRAGTFNAKSPRARCSLGNACDRDRLNAAFLRDVPDHVLARVTLCPQHQEAARPSARQPEAAPAQAGAHGASPAQSSASGRRRKQPRPEGGPS